MNFLHGLIIQLFLGVMVLGMTNSVEAGPIPRVKESALQTQKVGQPSMRGIHSSGNPLCRQTQNAGSEDFSLSMVPVAEFDCPPLLGNESSWIYAPGCGELGLAPHRMQSERCLADEKIVTNVGNLIVHSSDRVLGRVDVSVEMDESKPNVLPPVILSSQQDEKSLGHIRPDRTMNRILMATAFRFDRLGQEVFDGEEESGSNMILDFDHQLVMAGKLAHLVPKSGPPTRKFEFGDLIFLLLFAIMPERKRIKNFFRYARQFGTMRFDPFS